MDFILSSSDNCFLSSAECKEVYRVIGYYSKVGDNGTLHQDTTGTENNLDNCHDRFSC